MSPCDEAGTSTAPTDAGGGRDFISLLIAPLGLMMVLLKHRRRLIGILALSVLLLGGCSGSGQTPAGGEQSFDAPAWYRTPPGDSASVTVTATATSRRKKAAIGKAVMAARTELAVTLHNIVEQARLGGGIPSSLEAKLDASRSVQIPVGQSAWRRRSDARLAVRVRRCDDVQGVLDTGGITRATAQGRIKSPARCHNEANRGAEDGERHVARIRSRGPAGRGGGDGPPAGGC